MIKCAVGFLTEKLVVAVSGTCSLCDGGVRELSCRPMRRDSPKEPRVLRVTIVVEGSITENVRLKDGVRPTQ